MTSYDSKIKVLLSRSYPAQTFKIAVRFHLVHQTASHELKNTSVLSTCLLMCWLWYGLQW